MNLLTRLAALLLLTGSVLAAEKPVAGPKGGKMVDPHTEFFVDQDRKVVITYYGDDMKPVAVADQTGVVWADAKTGRVKLSLEKKGDALVSTQSLPAGDGYNVMVQLKAGPDAKAKNHKIKFHEETCPECKRAEYACICVEHDSHDHEGHGHDH